MTQAFVVSFRGGLTADEVDVLERAGFRPHVRGMNTFEGLWPGEAPDDWESRHVVLCKQTIVQTRRGKWPTSLTENCPARRSITRPPRLTHGLLLCQSKRQSAGAVVQPGSLRSVGLPRALADRDLRPLGERLSGLRFEAEAVATPAHRLGGSDSGASYDW